MRIPGWLFVVLVAVVILAASGAAVLTVRWFGPVGGGAQSLASKNLEEQGIQLEQGPLYELGTFVVNLSSERGPGNFLRTAVVLQMDDEKAVKALDERKPAARDAVITALRRHTAAQLSQSDGMERLKESVRASVNALLASDHVRQVYFTDFIIQ